MLQIETQTALFQDMHQTLPDVFTKLPDGIVATLRVHHLLNNVIDPLVASRTSVQFHGELEAFILQPMLAIAASVLDKKAFAKQEPGFVLVSAQKHGTAYALAAEALTVAQSKNMFDAVSKKVMDISPIIRMLQAKNTKKQTEEEAARGVFDLIGSLNAVFASDSVYNSVYETIQSADTAELAASFADQLILLGGTGPGLQLPITVLPARAASMMQITQAIRLLLNPSMAEANKTGTPRRASDYQADAYALAVMFTMYLHHSQTADTYNIAFSGQPPTADAKVRMPLAVQSARRLAWMYSGVATAAQAFDYLLVKRLLSNVQRFIQPALVSSASQLLDIAGDLTVIDDVLSRSIPAPISSHEEWVWDVLTKLAGGKILLPEAFVTDVLATWPSIPTELHPEKGWDAIVWETFSSNQVNTSDLQSMSRSLANLVYKLRVNAQSLSTRVNSFLIHNQFDPNTLNVPNSLFYSEDILKSVQPIGANVYFNPWEPTPYSAPLKRFVLDASINEEDPEYNWIGKNKTYVPTCLPRLRIESKLETAIQFCPLAPLPVRTSIGQKFALSGIPRQYVAESVTGSLKNSFSEVAQAIRAQSKGLTGAFTYFQDAAAICAFGSEEQVASMIWAMSAMFQIYVVRDKDVKVTNLKPSESLAVTHQSKFPLPYIYGYPTAVFMSKQSAPSPGRSRSFTVKGAGRTATVWFVLHSHAMPVSRYSMYQVPLTHGVFVTVPISDTYSAAITEVLFEISSRTQEEEDVTATDDIYKKLQTTNELRMNAGEKITATQIHQWAATLTEYPHIAFQHFTPVGDVLNLSAGDVMAWAHTKLSRMVLPGSSDMLVQAAIADSYVIFEAKDAHTTTLFFDGGDANIDAITHAAPPSGQSAASTSGQMPTAGVANAVNSSVAPSNAQTDAPLSSGEIAKVAIVSLAETVATPSQKPVVQGDQKVSTFKGTIESKGEAGMAVGSPEADEPASEEHLTESEKAELKKKRKAEAADGPEFNAL